MLIFRTPATVARAQSLSNHEQQLVRYAESQHPSAGDEKRWLEAFKEWAKTEPHASFGPHSDPASTIEKRYREHLAAEGLSSDQVDLRWGSMLRTRQDDQEWWRL